MWCKILWDCCISDSPSCGMYTCVTIRYQMVSSGFYPTGGGGAFRCLVYLNWCNSDWFCHRWPPCRPSPTTSPPPRGSPRTTLPPWPLAPRRRRPMPPGSAGPPLPYRRPWVKDPIALILIFLRTFLQKDLFLLFFFLWTLQNPRKM